MKDKILHMSLNEIMTTFHVSPPFKVRKATLEHDLTEQNTPELGEVVTVVCKDPQIPGKHVIDREPNEGFWYVGVHDTTKKWEYVPTPVRLTSALVKIKSKMLFIKAIVKTVDAFYRVF